MKIFCIDIGNTTIRYGLVLDAETKNPGNILTPRLEEPDNELINALKDASQENSSLDGISFSSVVPTITPKLIHLLKSVESSLPIHQLTCDNCPIPINYPNPREIGQDRLANAIGAKAIYGLPSIVVDMGTTVNFDIVTSQGYEGGIIAPGLGVITRYLHEQTALLPQLDPEDLMVSTGIGKTTADAMKLGCMVGFEGMVRSLLDCVKCELKKLGHSEPAVIATGGSVGILPQSWKNDIAFNSDITLLGLALAFTQCNKY